MTAYASDGDAIQEKGFFFGYNNLVWLNIFVQSAGGLIVAVVIKYADNILKGFATSIAIVVSCLASVYLFDTIIDYVFAFGTFLVVLSVVLYSYTPATQLPLLPTSLSSSNSAASSPLLTSSDSSRSSSPKSREIVVFAKVLPVV